MRVRNSRIEAFLSWCANQVKDYVTPMSKGTLSKQYVKEKKLSFQPYYFSIYAPDEMLVDSIKKSKHSLEVQAKLMCLFSLPVNPELFKKLTQFATIELDRFRRITSYEHGETSFECEHRKPRDDKFKDFKKYSKKEADKENCEEEEDGDDLFEVLDSSTPITSPPMPKSTDQITKPAPKLEPLSPINSAQPTSSTSLPYLQEPAHSMSHPITDAVPHHPSFTPVVKLEKPEYSYHSSWLEPAPFSQDSSIEESRNSPSIGPESSYSNRATPMSSAMASTVHSQQSKFGEVLHKLEYFFLYKCKPELMPLCSRIKEAKEKFGQKTIQSSTIKSFFEVSLRLMVTRNALQAVKLEQEDIQYQPLLLNDLLKDLKAQHIIEGLNNIVDSIQDGVDNQEVISYHTIASTFSEMINNLAEIR